MLLLKIVVENEVNVSGIRLIDDEDRGRRKANIQVTGLCYNVGDSWSSKTTAKTFDGEDQLLKRMEKFLNRRGCRERNGFVSPYFSPRSLRPLRCKNFLKSVHTELERLALSLPDFGPVIFMTFCPSPKKSPRMQDPQTFAEQNDLEDASVSSSSAC
jgi:hypothetical protein